MLLDTTVQTSDLVREGPTGWTKPSGSQVIRNNIKNGVKDGFIPNLRKM